MVTLDLGLENKIIRVLQKKKKTISIAESCTGGILSERLTSVPGASKVFGWGIVSYSAQAKQKLLNVSRTMIKNYGEVSKEVATAMAFGVKKVSKSDYAIGITGIAGPTGGTKEKPVGLVYLSLISPKEQHIKKCLFRGNRQTIRKKSATVALQWLYDELKRQGG